MGTLVCVIVQRCRGATLPGAPPRSDRTAHFRRRRLGSRPGSRRKATGDNAAGRAAPGATGQYAAANAAGRRGETRQDKAAERRLAWSRRGRSRRERRLGARSGSGRAAPPRTSRGVEGRGHWGQRRPRKPLKARETRAAPISWHRPPAPSLAARAFVGAPTPNPLHGTAPRAQTRAQTALEIPPRGARP